jgi:hypothetical protein
LSLAFSFEVEPAPRHSSADALVLAFAWRPRIRAHCFSVPRPCPYVSCKHNNYLDILPRGQLRLNHPGLEPDEVPAETSCALDVASRGEHTYDALAPVMGTSRPRVMQIANSAMRRIRLPMLEHL